MVADKSLHMWKGLNIWEDYIKKGNEAKMLLFSSEYAVWACAT